MNTTNWNTVIDTGGMGIKAILIIFGLALVVFFITIKNGDETDE